MRSFCNLFILLSLCVFAQQISAQNPDILWQKTLTADTLPIRSIAIAEGKYVAALKGNQIVILDYVTGDSIKSFTAPKDMYGSDIVLGKGGERLYVFTRGTSYNSDIILQSWEVISGDSLNGIGMASFRKNPSFSYQPFMISSLRITSSSNGKYIAVGTSNSWLVGSCSGSGGSVRLFNTEDSIFVFQNMGPSRNPSDLLGSQSLKDEQTLSYPGNGGVTMLKISQLGNYLTHNQSSYYECSSLGQRFVSTSELSGFVSLSPKKTSINYNSYIPEYLFSFNEDYLLNGNQLYDFPPTRAFRKINKVGFVFLPDDNHMLVFKGAAGVAAISNIQEDTWEKVFVGDSLPENTIKTNASCTAFATATNLRITLWKLPDNLRPAQLTAEFSITKDTISINDTIFCTNKSYPFKRTNIYHWDFGTQDTTSQVIHPSYRYTSAGNYTVTLTVTDTLGRVNSVTKNIVVRGYNKPIGSEWINRSSNYKINTLMFSKNSTLLVSGSDDNTAKLWEVSKGKLYKIFTSNSPIVSAIFMKDEESIALNLLKYVKMNQPNHDYKDDLNNTLYLWNFIKDTTISRYSLPVEFVNYFEGPANYLNFDYYSISSDISPDNLSYLSGYRVVIDWCRLDPTHHGLPGGTPSFSSLLQSDNHRGNLFNYQLSTSKLIYAGSHSVTTSDQLLLFRPIYTLKIAPNNKHYAVIIEKTTNSPTIYLKDIATDSILRQIPTTATTMRFSPKKDNLLTNTQLWDIYDSVLVQSVTLPQVFEYHPDGVHVFTIRPDSSIGIYNLHLNTYEYIYPKQSNSITCIAVAPDGKHIATGDNVGFITVWKVPDTLKTSVQGDFTTQSINRSTIKTKDTIEFLNTTLPANDATLYYQWNFGDGTTSIEKSPKHRFTDTGTYTVTLMVFQYGRSMDTVVKVQYITVTEPIVVVNDDVSQFDNSVSIIPNPSYGESQIHLSFAKATDYTLTIFDNLGRQAANWEGNHASGKDVIVWKADVPAVVYYCVLKAGGAVKSVPIVIIK